MTYIKPEMELYVINEDIMKKSGEEDDDDNNVDLPWIPLDEN